MRATALLLLLLSKARASDVHLTMSSYGERSTPAKYTSNGIFDPTTHFFIETTVDSVDPQDQLPSSSLPLESISEELTPSISGTPSPVTLIDTISLSLPSELTSTPSMADSSEYIDQRDQLQSDSLQLESISGELTEAITGTLSPVTLIDSISSSPVSKLTSIPSTVDSSDHIDPQDQLQSNSLQSERLSGELTAASTGTFSLVTLTNNISSLLSSKPSYAPSTFDDTESAFADVNSTIQLNTTVSWQLTSQYTGPGQHTAHNVIQRQDKNQTTMSPQLENDTTGFWVLTNMTTMSWQLTTYLVNETDSVGGQGLLIINTVNFIVGTVVTVIIILLLLFIYCGCRCCLLHPRCAQKCKRSNPSCAICLFNMSNNDCMRIICCFQHSAYDDWGAADQRQRHGPNRSSQDDVSVEMVTLDNQNRSNITTGDVIHCNIPSGQLGVFFIPGSVYVGGFFKGNVMSVPKSTVDIRCGDRIVTIDDLAVDQMYFHEFVELVYGTRYLHPRRLTLLRNSDAPQHVMTTLRTIKSIPTTPESVPMKGSPNGFQVTRSRLSSIQITIPHGALQLVFLSNVPDGKFVVDRCNFLSHDGTPMPQRISSDGALWPDIRPQDELQGICGLSVEGHDESTVQSMLLQSNEQSHRFLTVGRLQEHSMRDTSMVKAVGSCSPVSMNSWNGGRRSDQGWSETSVCRKLDKSLQLTEVSDSAVSLDDGLLDPMISTLNESNTPHSSRRVASKNDGPKTILGGLGELRQFATPLKRTQINQAATHSEMNTTYITTPDLSSHVPQHTLNNDGQELFVGVLVGSLTIDICVMTVRRKVQAKHTDSKNTLDYRVMFQKSFGSSILEDHIVDFDSSDDMEKDRQERQLQFRRDSSKLREGTRTPRLAPVDGPNTPRWGNNTQQFLKIQSPNTSAGSYSKSLSMKSPTQKTPPPLKSSALQSSTKSFSLLFRAICEHRKEGGLRERRELWIQPYLRLQLQSIQNAALQVLPYALRSIHSTVRESVNSVLYALNYDINAVHAGTAQNIRHTTLDYSSLGHNITNTEIGPGPGPVPVYVAFGMNAAVFRRARHLKRHNHPGQYFKNTFPRHQGICPDHLCAALDFTLGTNHVDYSAQKLVKSAGINGESFNLFVVVWNFGFTSACGYRIHKQKHELLALKSFSQAKGRLDIVSRVFHSVKRKMLKQRHAKYVARDEDTPRIPDNVLENMRASVQAQLREWTNCIVQARKKRKVALKLPKNQGMEVQRPQQDKKSFGNKGYDDWTFKLTVDGGEEFEVPMSLSEYRQLNDMTFTTIVDGILQAYIGSDFIRKPPLIFVIGPRKPRVPLLLSRVISKLERIHREIFKTGTALKQKSKSRFRIVSARRNCLVRGAALFSILQHQNRAIRASSAAARRKANVARQLSGGRPRARHVQNLGDDQIVSSTSSSIKLKQELSPRNNVAKQNSYQRLGVHTGWSTAIKSFPILDGRN